MKLIISGLLLSLSSILATSWSDFKPGQKINHSNEMMIRIAEIEIDSLYLDAYIALLKEEAAMSVRLEPGVICIFPLFEKEHPTQIRITEIYINKEAYDAHLVTPHFLKYKTTTT